MLVFLPRILKSPTTPDFRNHIPSISSQEILPNAISKFVWKGKLAANLGVFYMLIQ